MVCCAVRSVGSVVGALLLCYTHNWGFAGVIMLIIMPIMLSIMLISMLIVLTCQLIMSSSIIRTMLF